MHQSISGQHKAVRPCHPQLVSEGMNSSQGLLHMATPLHLVKTVPNGLDRPALLLELFVAAVAVVVFLCGASNLYKPQT